MAEKIDERHPIYDRQQVKRDAFNATVGGTDGLREGGELYLQRYPGEKDETYKRRLNSSITYGLIKDSVDALTGKVFDEPINTDKVNKAIQPYLDNFDAAGTDFQTFARQTFQASFDGFSLVLVDSPQVAEQEKAILAERGQDAVKLLNLRPRAALYTASNVINWHYTVNKATHVRELVLLVLHERHETLVNRFEHKFTEYYRVYQLVNGVVSWELWRENEDTSETKEKFTLESSGVLSNLTRIPVALIGGIECVPKLLDEARNEILIYQKKSSFDVLEYLSIPVFFTIGYPENAPPLSLGADTHLRLPGDANIKAEVGFAQIDSSGHDSLRTTIDEMKEDVKGRTTLLGANINQISEKTATQVTTENKDKQARLVVWRDELKKGLETALDIMCEFQNIKDANNELEFVSAWDTARMMQEAQMNAQAQADNAKAANQ